MNLTDEELQDLFYTYRPSQWAIDYIEPALGVTLDPWQKDFLDDESKRSLLLIHRQGGKSTAVAIKAIHRALFRRNQTVVLISPSQRQSSDLLRTIRRMMANLPGASDSLIVDNILTLEMANGSRIVSYPGSSWTIRGATANLVIVDEAAGVPDEIFASVSPMLLTTNGQYIVISTPIEKKGAFYSFYVSDDWKKYTVKASQNERMKLPERAEFLAREFKSIGSRLYSREYECEFLDDSDAGRIKRSWWQYYNIDDIHKLRSASRDIYISWDTASKVKEINDYSVATIWLRIQDNHYLLDMVREKMLFPELVDKAIALTNKYSPTLNLIEDKSSGTALIQQLRVERPNMPIKAMDPGGMDKGQRLDIATPAIESGHVYLPATYLDNVPIPTSAAQAVMDNLASFPEGEHDDITDSVSQYLGHVRDHGRKPTIEFF